jgi:hypothetical protein
VAFHHALPGNSDSSLADIGTDAEFSANAEIAACLQELKTN